MTTIAQAQEIAELRPQSRPQELFFLSPADIVIYGGAAGGGKTWSLLVEALRNINNPGFAAVIFRASYPQIIQQGGLWDEAAAIYPFVGGKPYVGNTEFRFPSGAVVTFAHLGSEAEKFNWMGAQIPLLGFDQLEHFSETQFFYMLTRNRSLCGVRPYVRATCNPDAESWIAKFISWWIDQETGYPIRKRAGAIRWFVRVNEELVWADTREELEQRYGKESYPKSVTFIPANVYDNKILMERDPAYLGNLRLQPLVERERLLKGNWKVKASAGKVVSREWFKTVPAVPAGGREVRFWDFAATEKKLKGNDPDFTACCKMRRVGGRWIVVDARAWQVGPAEVDRLFLNLSMQDFRAAQETGTRYQVAWEIEPGSAGIRENRRLVGMLSGIPASGRKPSGDKITRGKAFASQAEVGNVDVLAAEWNDRWLTHLHHQPDWPHDDEWDAAVGAFNELLREQGEAQSFQG